MCLPQSNVTQMADRTGCITRLLLFFFRFLEKLGDLNDGLAAQGNEA